MNPRFAAAVDPIVLYSLELFERLANGDSPSPEDEREQIQNLIRAAEAQLSEKQGWDLAKYALVSWIDELLIATPWNGQNWWENNLLEFTHFKTRSRATDFFLRAEQATEMSHRDALEVYYVCVILGFRGLYALEDSLFVAEGLKLAPDIESWVRRKSRSIQLGQGRPMFAGSDRPGQGAPPLDGKFVLVGTVLMAVILAAFTVVIGAYTAYDKFKLWHQ